MLPCPRVTFASGTADDFHARETLVVVSEILIRSCLFFPCRVWFESITEIDYASESDEYPPCAT